MGEATTQETGKGGDRGTKGPRHQGTEVSRQVHPLYSLKQPRDLGHKKLESRNFTKSAVFGQKMTVAPKRLVVEQNGENFCREWNSRGGGGCGDGVYQVWCRSAHKEGQGRGGPRAV